MSVVMGDQEKELDLIEKCLSGDNAALELFRERYIRPLIPLLVSRGGSATTVDDVVGTLWTDCVAGRQGGDPLLAKYHEGRGGISQWLRRVALNRLVDQVRISSRVSYLSMEDGQEDQKDTLMDAPIAAPDQTWMEGSAVRELLRQSLETGFQACPDEALLMLRLVYIEGITQQEVARMWGCHRVTVSRELKRAMAEISESTLRAAARIDPHLKLTWEDFLELCAVSELDFL